MHSSSLFGMHIKGPSLAGPLRWCPFQKILRHELVTKTYLSKSELVDLTTTESNLKGTENTIAADSAIAVVKLNICDDLVVQKTCTDRA